MTELETRRLTLQDQLDAEKDASEQNRRGLDCLVEVHDAGEMERAMALGGNLIGINNRDLTTVTTDLAVTQRLATTYRQALRQGNILLVSESGLREHRDLEQAAAAGAQAVLVGEALMGQPDVAAALRALREDVGTPALSACAAATGRPPGAERLVPPVYPR